MSGLSYASGRDMPPGMQVAAADKIIERFRNASAQVAAAMQEQAQSHPVAAEQEECNCEVFPWAINNAPTVDAVEVVHGQWEEWWPGISLIMTGEEMLYRCSACGAKYADIEGYKYCPNCGAKMDGDGNDQ